MIRINLLPHREARRKQKQVAFYALLALGGIAGIAVVLAVGGYNARQLSVQDQRNLVLKQANGELDKKIAEIKTLKEEIEALKARQQAVQDVQSDRNQPAYLLDELVRQTPEGMHLKTLKQEGQRVVLTGYAQSQERVAELLRNLSGNSPWLERPELTEVRAVTLAQSKTGRKVVEFTLSVSIKRPPTGEDEGQEGASKGAAKKPADAAGVKP